MPYPKFDRDRIRFRKLAERTSKVDISKDHVNPGHGHAAISSSDEDIIRNTAERIKKARKDNRPVILAFGAHTIKNGLAPVLIGLMENDWLTHLATNGAGIIHDWEFAFQGRSSEDVRANVSRGEFGIWEETGYYINLGIAVGAYEGLGYGESVGKMISREGLDIPEKEVLKYSADHNFEPDPDLAAAAADLAGIITKYRIAPGFLKIPHPFKKYSVQAAAYRLGIPFTGHPMFGHDIIYTHPANNGAAIGRTAQNDFLAYAESVRNIENGVYISLGSAVMSPMIFEKALSMSRNVEMGKGNVINNQFMLVVDLAESGWDWKKGEPPADNPSYYLRYIKTFSRMGGEMQYLRADNRDFLVSLHNKLD
ncbi:MAG TPA: hypothetical protein VK155_03480 [Bacteroidales bacterium]|jgi:hypothetical protein|nr:hypothetical protein [Bacteroidales bacterium]